MFLIVGAGAVGTILATYLAFASRPVRIYARAKDLETFGAVSHLRVDRVGGAPPLIANRPPLQPSLDLAQVRYLVLGVKFPQLAGLLDQLPALPPGMTLVSTLNGVAAMRMLRERFPGHPATCLTVMYNGQLLGPLHAQITTKPAVVVGSDDRELQRQFDGTGMAAQLAAGDTGAWGKLLINLANAIGATTHTTFKDLLTQPDLRIVFAALLDEALDALRRTGTPFKLLMPFPPWAFHALLLHGGPLPWWFARAKNGVQEGAFPSMVSDVEAGRRTEVDQLNGEVVRLGREGGFETPRNAKLVELVHAMDGRQPQQYLAPSELRSRLGL